MIDGSVKEQKTLEITWEHVIVRPHKINKILIVRQLSQQSITDTAVFLYIILLDFSHTKLGNSFWKCYQMSSRFHTHKHTHTHSQEEVEPPCKWIVFMYMHTWT